MGKGVHPYPLHYGEYMKNKKNMRKYVHDVPLDVWYSLLVAATVDKAWDRAPGRLLATLESVFGED